MRPKRPLAVEDDGVEARPRWPSAPPWKAAQPGLVSVSVIALPPVRVAERNCYAEHIDRARRTQAAARSAKQTLWPATPMEFESATCGSRCRALSATYSRSGVLRLIVGGT